MPEPIEKRLVTEAKLSAELNPQSARLALLEGAAGFPAEPLALEADIVRGLLSDPASTVGKTIKDTYGPTNGARPVGKGELVINVKDYGAKGDGVADDTAAIIAAEAAAYALGGDVRLFIPTGPYRTSGTIRFRTELDASQATIRYYGVGTAVVVGDNTRPGIVTARREFRLPRVINMLRGTTGWDGTSVGIKGVNLNTCQMHVPFVQDFESGLIAYGYSGGFAHTTIHLGAIWENHKNLTFSSDATGYSNQNLILNGRLQQSATKGAVVDDKEAKQVWLTGEGVPSEGANAGRPNNNTFINTSFEGHNIAYYKADIDGRYNVFLNCRWETQSSAPRVIYRETARWNKIDGGYNALTIEETFMGTLGGGEIRDHVGAFTRALPVAGQSIPNNVWAPILWGEPIGRRISLASTTGEFTPRPGRWLIMATVTFAPNATGRRMARLNIAGSVADIAEAPGNAQRTTMKLQVNDLFDGAKTVKVEANQTSGADLGLESTPPYVAFRAEYLGY